MYNHVGIIHVVPFSFLRSIRYARSSSTYFDYIMSFSNYARLFYHYRALKFLICISWPDPLRLVLPHRSSTIESGIYSSSSSSLRWLCSLLLHCKFSVFLSSLLNCHDCFTDCSPFWVAILVIHAILVSFGANRDVYVGLCYVFYQSPSHDIVLNNPLVFLKCNYWHTR